MDLSVVIVNWNTRDLLSDCLQSVFLGLGDLEAEIFVVDNDSEDGSSAMVRREFPKVRLIQSLENRGFAGGNNLALRRVSGRHVLLLNTDTIVHGSVISDCVAWLDRNPRVGVMGPRLLNSDGSVQPSCSAFPSLRSLTMQLFGITRIARWDSYRMTGWDWSEERSVDVISGAAMFVQAKAMDEVGLLDESFYFYGEETDWCHRFRVKEWDLKFVPIPEITHFGGGSVRRLNHRRDVMLTEGTTRLQLKHSGHASAITCFIILALHNITRAAFWSAVSLTGRPGATARARHFIHVMAELPRAWPSMPERTTNS
jgi:GT2 family glycosyltransferase